jgi:patatin-like phospholipase/acyl hydrolase
MEKNLDPKMKLWESDDPLCRVWHLLMEHVTSFVCTVSAFLNRVKLLRSYKSRKIGHSNYNCFVWEAIRATSAAPLFFEPITLKSSKATFVNGGIRANNPISQISSEAE